MASMLKKIKNKDVRMKQGEVWQCVNAALSFTDSGDFKNPSGCVMTMTTIAVIADYGDHYHILPLDPRGIGVEHNHIFNAGYPHKQFAEYYSKGKIKRIK